MIGSPSSLLIDWDHPEDRIPPSRIAELLRDVGITVGSVKTERSGSGFSYHCVINVLEELSPLEIVFLQLLLGSDVKRELLNYKRIRPSADYLTPGANLGPWNVLYANKVYRRDKTDGKKTKT